jgi:hypothetical protein
MNQKEASRLDRGAKAPDIPDVLVNFDCLMMDFHGAGSPDAVEHPVAERSFFQMAGEDQRILRMSPHDFKICFSQIGIQHRPGDQNHLTRSGEIDRTISGQNP